MKNTYTKKYAQESETRKKGREEVKERGKKRKGNEARDR